MNTQKLFKISIYTTIILVFSLLSAWAVPPEQSDHSAVQQEAKDGGYQLINVDGLWDQFQNNKDNLLLIDTRQEWEHHAGFIKDSINFPMEPTWLARLTQKGALEQFLGPDKNKTFVFY